MGFISKSIFEDILSLSGMISMWGGETRGLMLICGGFIGAAKGRKDALLGGDGGISRGIYGGVGFVTI